MDTHTEQRVIERYVLGMMEPCEVPAFEEHLSGCAECASALAEEARLELKLQGLVPWATERPSSVRRVRRPLVPVAAAGLAAAVLLLVLVGISLRPPEPPGAGAILIRPVPLRIARDSVASSMCSAREVTLARAVRVDESAVCAEPDRPMCVVE